MIVKLTEIYTYLMKTDRFNLIKNTQAYECNLHITLLNTRGEVDDFRV